MSSLLHPCSTCQEHEPSRQLEALWLGKRLAPAAFVTGIAV